MTRAGSCGEPSRTHGVAARDRLGRIGGDFGDRVLACTGKSGGCARPRERRRPRRDPLALGSGRGCRIVVTDAAARHDPRGGSGRAAGTRRTAGALARVRGRMSASTTVGRTRVPTPLARTVARRKARQRCERDKIQECGKEGRRPMECPLQDRLPSGTAGTVLELAPSLMHALKMAPDLPRWKRGNYWNSRVETT